MFPSKAKLVRVAVGASVFVAGGVFILYSPPTLTRLVVGYLVVAFFGIGLVYALLRLVKPVPSLVISSEGIFENGTAIGAGLLRWSEIAEVRIYTFMNQRFLGIIPTNLEEVLHRQSALKRGLMRLNKGLVETPFNIPENVLPVKLEEIVREIDARRGMSA